jgi:hypothetical protein
MSLTVRVRHPVLDLSLQHRLETLALAGAVVTDALVGALVHLVCHRTSGDSGEYRLITQEHTQHAKQTDA